jgi:hypothetical protein
VLGELDLLGLGPALGEPPEGVLQPALGGEDHQVLAHVGWLAGQDLAEDRTQGEDVRALIQLFHTAKGLLRRHVGGRTHHGARHGLRSLLVGADRGDHRLVRLSLRCGART